MKENQDWKKLCSQLKEEAEKRGITQGDIAEKTGFTQSNVSRMLTAKYAPALDNFLILADAIGVKQKFIKVLE